LRVSAYVTLILRPNQPAHQVKEDNAIQVIEK
jgi:hypothetical protein